MQLVQKLSLVIPEWGLALFGKRDGFQIFWASSLCQYFRQTESWNKIVSLIQLPQESLRLAPGQELVGMSRVVIREEPFWLYTRYQYALDQYKRDGYKASLLACRQVASRSTAASSHPTSSIGSIIPSAQQSRRTNGTNQKRPAALVATVLAIKTGKLRPSLQKSDRVRSCAIAD